MRIITEGPLRISRDVIAAGWKRRAPDTRIIIRDAWCRGLALLVNSTGMTWRYDYRPRGINPATGRRWPVKSMMLGRPDTIGPEAARQEAARLKGIVASGGDPAAARRAAVMQATRERAATLGRLAEEYAALLPRRAKLRGAGTPSDDHVAGELRALRKALAEMGATELPAVQLSGAQIRNMLAAHGAHPSAARARFGALSRFCDWLLDDEQISANPCQRLARTARPRPARSRSTYLQPAQLATLWHAARALEPVPRDFLRLLIAVPCRRGEASRLDWRHLDLKAAVWAQPDKLTKNDEPHRFHLPPLILEVLQARHAAAGHPRSGLVFPAPRSRRVMTTWRDIKDALMDAVYWQAADALAPARRDLARVLIALPARLRDATATLDWRQLDLAAARWQPHGLTTRRGRPRWVALPPRATDVLQARHGAAGQPRSGLVFPPADQATTNCWDDIRQELAMASGIGDWRFHDMRRSFATALGEAGVPEPVVDAVLNHRQAATRGGVLGVYQRAARWPEQRAAMERWGAILAAAITGEAGAVIPFPAVAGAGG